MKKSEKIITGMVVGAVVALLFIPKTRKLITEAMGTLTDSLKNVINKSDQSIQNT